MARGTKKNTTEEYRELTQEEQDLLFAQYEKWAGNVNQMILDKDVLFKSYNQLHFYKHKYKFVDKYVEVRRKRAVEVMAQLKDGKTRAIEQALRILESRNVFVYNKSGMQVFDKDGNPVIVENLPFYKEIKVAWEILKTELGEATSIAKNNVGFEDAPLAEITFEIVNAPRTGKKED